MFFFEKEWEVGFGLCMWLLISSIFFVCMFVFQCLLVAFHLRIESANISPQKTPTDYAAGWRIDAGAQYLRISRHHGGDFDGGILLLL